MELMVEVFAKSFQLDGAVNFVAGFIPCELASRCVEPVQSVNHLITVNFAVIIFPKQSLKFPAEVGQHNRADGTANQQDEKQSAEREIEFCAGLRRDAPCEIRNPKLEIRIKSESPNDRMRRFQW